jgi:hypothetical protein
MTMKRALAAATASCVVGAGLVLLVPTQAGAGTVAKEFANCTALNKKHPHGVGRPGARDSTSGTPVTSFKRSKKLYKANKKSDRDKDGIACEKL